MSWCINHWVATHGVIDITKSSLLPCAIVFATLSAIALGWPSSARADAVIPNVQQGVPGSLLAGPVDPDMGRLAVITYLGGHIITVPETPGSEPGDHQIVQAWDLSDPSNPQLVAPTNPNDNGGHFGRTGNPLLAHGSISRGNEVFIGLNTENSNDGQPGYLGFDSVRLNADGSLTHARWSGPNPPPLIDRNGSPVLNGSGFQDYANWSTKGSMMRPWSVGDNWSYNDNLQNVTRLTLRNRLLAQWDIVAETGVAGFGNFLGNLLIYASDQRATGVAVYDAADIFFDPATNEWKPRLLDVLNTPPGSGGIGGYWSEISGHYLVIGRQRESGNPASFNGMQVVDFSDPTDLKLHCQTELLNPEGDSFYTLEASPRYVGLQDNYAFLDNFKVNIETCQVVAIADISDGQRTDTECFFGFENCPKRIIHAGEYSRVVGNLWVTGGFPIQPDLDGMGIWVHQSAPDTNPPYIAHQVPAVGQTNYPINAPLGFSIPETLRSETLITNQTALADQTETLTLVEVDGGSVQIDYVLSHQGVLTVNPIDGLQPDTTYEVSFTSGIEDAAGNPMAANSFRFSTGSSIEEETPSVPVLDDVSVSPAGSIAAGSSVLVSLIASNAAEYLITIDGEEDQWTNSNSRSIRFDTPGTFFVNARARNSAGSSAVIRVEIVVNSATEDAEPGLNSSQLVCDQDEGAVWVVNPDNNSVTVLNADTLDRMEEIFGPTDPQALAQVDDEIWVVARGADEILIFDRSSNNLKKRINTGYGTAPSGIVAHPDSDAVFVTFYGTGELARFSRSTPEATAETIDLAPTVKTMAMTPDGDRLLVARLISGEHWGEVFEIDTNVFKLSHTYRLHKHFVADTANDGRGKPNYLTSMVVSGQTNRAYIVAKKDNVDRGLLAGLDQDLDDDNSVRAMGMVLDLSARQELTEERIDFDNTSSLSALAMSPDSQYLYIAEQGKNSVLAMRLTADGRFSGDTNTYRSGLAPQGLCVDSSSGKLFAKNFTDRSVSAFDLSASRNSPTVQTTATVTEETLAPDELAGLKLFYNAFEGLNESNPIGRMSAEGYISCASCHLDAGHDGNTWDFTGRGEGLRNNIALQGRGGIRFGQLHWSANFDEVQDFNQDIRNAFKGRGFLSAEQLRITDDPLGTPKASLSEELDSLAAYLASLGKSTLPRSPARVGDGQLSSSALAGAALFASEGCADCHAGRARSDNQIHNVGTQTNNSGSRAGEALPGIKTPSLLGAFASGPYFHNGQAQSLSDVFTTAGGDTLQTDDLDLYWNFNVEEVRQSNFSYLRAGGGFLMLGNDSLFGRWETYNSGVAGPGKVRVRYGSSTEGGVLVVRIDDVEAGRIDLQRLPTPQGQDALFVESTTVDVEFPADGNNLSFEYLGDGQVIIDEITVSTSADLELAQVHTRAAQLTGEQQTDLVNYVNSLDQMSAPEDLDTDIFGAGDANDQDHSDLLLAVLPGSRSTQVGDTVTAFATMLNPGAARSNCGLTPSTEVPADFTFRATNGAINERQDVAAGGAINFVISFTPTSAFSARQVAFAFDCAATPSGRTIAGVNTLLLSASDQPVADVIAIALTSSDNGIVELNQNVGAFAVATANLGAETSIRATATAGSVPVSVTLCQTNPQTGACINPAIPSISSTVTIPTNATPTFSVFVSATQPIAFDPAQSRITVVFSDGSGAIRGMTSVAVQGF